jgi:TIR domain
VEHPAPQVFISYRRDDSAGYARAIYDALAARLGHERVFMDVDDIGAGQAFDAVIQRAVGGSKLLLVLIGPRWTGPRPGQAPRIDEPADLVRREVEAGLAKGMRVIPLLLDGTPMPGREQLPASLHALPGLNAMAVGNPRFADDMARLGALVEATLGPAPAPTANAAAGQPFLAGRRGAWITTAVVALGALAAVGFWLRPSPSRAPAAAARAPINGLWQAAVRYPWPNADYVERFEFSGDGNALSGSASFLQVPRGVLAGAVEGNAVRFVTRTVEESGGTRSELTHRYRGELVGEQLRLTMQTEGGSASGLPVTIVATRAAPR